MAQIVLIHGSWHWSGCFHKLEKLLKNDGHRTVSVDNASHGNDSTAWDAIADMKTYNANAIDLLNKSAEPVVLVGHSMGGVTLSHLADVMPDKISKLVYLTAFMTNTEKCANDYIMAHAENPTCAPLWSVLSPVNEWAGIEIAGDKPDQVKEAFYADCSDDDIGLSAANVVKINTSIPNIYVPKTTASHERHYIKCTNDRAIPLQAQEEMISEFSDTKVHSLDSSHSPFYSQPDAVARIISNLA